MKILITHISDAGKGTDLTELVKKIKWSGSILNAGRKLDFEILSSPTDYYLPRPQINCGDLIIAKTSEKELFRGFVFLKDKSYKGESISFTAYDPAIRLLKNEGAYNFKNTTAEDITMSICKEFGIPAGDIAKTSILQNKLCIGESLYEIIMKAYTHASKINNKKYMIHFTENKLNLIEKGQIISGFVLQDGYNILESSYSEDIEYMVDKVIIVDEAGKKTGEVANQEWIKLYGLFQKVYKQEKDKNHNTMANSMLKDAERQANVSVLGDERCIAGTAVMIKDSYTGLIGKFYVDSDTHNFEDDNYTMDLSLNFQNIMDEKEYREAAK